MKSFAVWLFSTLLSIYFRIFVPNSDLFYNYSVSDISSETDIRNLSASKWTRHWPGLVTEQSMVINIFFWVKKNGQRKESRVSNFLHAKGSYFRAARKDPRQDGLGRHHWFLSFNKIQNLSFSVYMFYSLQWNFILSVGPFCSTDSLSRLFILATCGRTGRRTTNLWPTWWSDRTATFNRRTLIIGEYIFVGFFSRYLVNEKLVHCL